jgi:uncharacterized protein HemX
MISFTLVLASNPNSTLNASKINQETGNSISLINIAVSVIVSLVVALIGFGTERKKLIEQRNQFQEQLKKENLQFKQQMEFQWAQLLQQQRQFKEERDQKDPILGHESRIPKAPAKAARDDA